MCIPVFAWLFLFGICLNFFIGKQLNYRDNCDKLHSKHIFYVHSEKLLRVYPKGMIPCQNISWHLSDRVRQSIDDHRKIPMV